MSMAERFFASETAELARERITSPIKSRAPPEINPHIRVSGAEKPRDTHISAAGRRSDQKDADIITPEAKPSMALSSLLFIFLKNNTAPAPAAVRLHVKIVAIKACVTNARDENHSKIFTP
jgi:hypothetical protein